MKIFTSNLSKLNNKIEIELPLNISSRSSYIILLDSNDQPISNKQIRWEKKNLFWIDPSDHFVWKSIQHISPKLPPFILQVTKRPQI